MSDAPRDANNEATPIWQSRATIFALCFLTAIVVTWLGSRALVNSVTVAGSTADKVIDKTGETVQHIADSFFDLFRTDSWTTVLSSSGLGTTGSNDLVVAKHTGVDTFERSKRWTLNLSTIGVQAKVQYQFNYFVPLDRT